MNTYNQWDPFSELRRTMDNLFDQGFSRPWRLMSGADYGTDASMPVDIWETDDAVVLEAAVPGVKPDDVKIEVTNGVLTIKAEHPRNEADDRRQFHRRELTS